jgi:hypothetical protein
MEILNPDYPEGFYPLKQFGKEFGYEVTTLKGICKQLSIDITSIERTTYISLDAKPILEKALIAKKGGIPIDYSTTTTTTKVISPPKVKMDAPQAPPNAGLVVREGVVASGTPEHFFQMLMEVMKQQQQAPPPSASPLQQQRELRDAVDMGFLLTTEQLANIFGLKKSSISSWKTGHRRLGFQFTKIKENNISLWKVEQY